MSLAVAVLGPCRLLLFICLPSPPQTRPQRALSSFSFWAGLAAEGRLLPAPACEFLLKREAWDPSRDGPSGHIRPSPAASAWGARRRGARVFGGDAHARLCLCLCLCAYRHPILVRAVIVRIIVRIIIIMGVCALSLLRCLHVGLALFII